MFELAIENGRVYQDGAWTAQTVYIQDGIIARISAQKLDARERIDAQNKMVLPGLIDPHVHLAMPAGNGLFSADDFVSGSCAAVHGGITTVIDFTDEATSAEQLRTFTKKKKALAAESAVDVALHAAMADPQDDPDTVMQTIAELGLCGLKLYTTYKEGGMYSPYATIERLMQAAARWGVHILVHAEQDNMLDVSNTVPFCEHGTARPAQSETQAVLTLCRMARRYGTKLYIVHISAGSTLLAVQKEYGDLLGKQLFLESAPHYFCLNDAMLHRADGYRFTMTPPLRSAAEQAILCNHRAMIDAIGTDHCPFMRAQKEHRYTAEIPMGMGSLSDSFMVMYKRFGDAIIPQYTENVAKIHGLWGRKGALQPGFDADVVIFDPDAPAEAPGTGSVCDDSMYTVEQKQGRFCQVFRRGVCLLKDGVYHQEERGKGRYLPVAGTAEERR